MVLWAYLGKRPVIAQGHPSFQEGPAGSHSPQCRTPPSCRPQRASSNASLTSSRWADPNAAGPYGRVHFCEDWEPRCLALRSGSRRSRADFSALRSACSGVATARSAPRSPGLRGGPLLTEDAPDLDISASISKPRWATLTPAPLVLLVRRPSEKDYRGECRCCSEPPCSSSFSSCPLAFCIDSPRITW